MEYVSKVFQLLLLGWLEEKVPALRIDTDHGFRVQVIWATDLGCGENDHVAAYC